MWRMAPKLSRSIPSAKASSRAFMTSMLSEDARLCSSRRLMASVSKHARAESPACSNA